MPILLKISGLLLTGVGAFLVQNNPGEVRNNICAWDFVAPCPDWFDSAALNQVVFLCLMVVSGLFFLSLIIPPLANNYRQTVTEIAQFAPPKKPPKPQNEIHDFPLADLDEWRNVDPQELWRAGCLWKGYKPHYPIPFVDPVYASFIMLVNAAKTGQLTVTNPGTEVDAWSLVSRSELARFALSKGEMPEFLRDIETTDLPPIQSELPNFLISADELVDRVVSDENQFNEWKGDYQTWYNATFNFIREHISASQAYSFSKTGLIAVVKFDGAYNDEHNGLLNSLSVYRESLRHLHELES